MLRINVNALSNFVTTTEVNVRALSTPEPTSILIFAVAVVAQPGHSLALHWIL